MWHFTLNVNNNVEYLQGYCVIEFGFGGQK